MGKVLLTGGTGYIGSHVAIVLAQQGYDVVLADNLSNSFSDVVADIGKLCVKSPIFEYADLTHKEYVDLLFAKYDFDAVIHLAASKYVDESIQKPVEYYANNILSTVNLLSAMREHGVHKLIFSSSASVYGSDNKSPYIEDMPLDSATNPYAMTKVVIERILQDACIADRDLSVVALRYFNPIGAHPTGIIGDNPRSGKGNLMAYVVRTAAREQEYLSIYGTDYNTSDGTAVRDFIHVMDIAHGHVSALHYLEQFTGFDVFNLGTGRGVSVRELVSTFEAVNGVHVPYKVCARRDGDLAEAVADSGKAKRVLRWKSTYSLADMCRDEWNYYCRLHYKA